MEDEIEVLNFDVGDISTESDASVTNGPMESHPRVTELPPSGGGPSQYSLDHVCGAATPGRWRRHTLYIDRNTPPSPRPPRRRSKLPRPPRRRSKLPPTPEAEQAPPLTLPSPTPEAEQAPPPPPPPPAVPETAARRPPRTQRKCRSFSSTCGFTACSRRSWISPSCRALL